MPATFEGDMLDVGLEVTYPFEFKKAIAECIKCRYNGTLISAEFANSTDYLFKLVHDNTDMYYIFEAHPKIAVNYYAEGAVQVGLARKSDRYIAQLEMEAGVPFEVYKINAEGEGVLTVDGAKYVLSLPSAVETPLRRRHSMSLAIFPYTNVTVKVYDRVGNEVKGAKVLLVHKEVGRRYVCDEGETKEIPSGKYGVEVHVFGYEEKTEATVSLYGGVLVIGLSVDMRTVAGQTLRLLLAYIPVAVIIPIMFLLGSAPFLVRRKRE